MSMTAILVIIFVIPSCLAVKEQTDTVDQSDASSKEQRNGHGFDGQPIKVELEKVKRVGQFIVYSSEVVKLKVVDPHSEHGFRPFRHYRENKIRKENNEFLYNYMQEQEKQKAVESESKVTAMLKDALKILKTKTNESAHTSQKRLAQDLLLALELQSQNELHLLKNSQITALAKQEDIS